MWARWCTYLTATGLPLSSSLTRGTFTPPLTTTSQLMLSHICYCTHCHTLTLHISHIPHTPHCTLCLELVLCVRNCDQLLSEDFKHCRRNQNGRSSCVLSIIVIPLTVQPLTFELSEAPAACNFKFGSKVKCVVKKAYKQSGRGLGDQSDY